MGKEGKSLSVSWREQSEPLSLPSVIIRIVYPNSKLEINEFASAIKRAVICCWRGWRCAIRDHTHPSPAFPPIPPPFLLEKYEMAARW